MSATITPPPAPRVAQRRRREHPVAERLIAPVTRVGGGLAVHLEHDAERITDAHIAGTSFRGYEPILVGRDPRDAMPLSSRSCGWCGSLHATTASLALEMAWGLRPPPMARALRSVAQATEAIWAQAAQLAVRAGPDWCEPVVRRSTPWLWDRATRTEAPRGKVHGFRTIGELMAGLTPVTGRHWRETLPVGRRVLEMVELAYGKFPHPSVPSPGGVGSTLTLANFTEYYTRLYRSVDYVKQIIALWDDLIDFLLEADPRFAELGRRPASFLHAGAWEIDEDYDSGYTALSEGGRRRLAPPGAMVDGVLVTGDLAEIQAGITEDVTSAFYEVGESGSGTAPDGSPLPQHHPWNRTTVPAAGPRDFAGRYSWCTAPRWRERVVESTPLGRLWLAATRTDMPPNEYIEPTGTSVQILVPEHLMPETVVEWHVPAVNNALERLRAAAYGVAFAGLSAGLELLKGFEMTRRGEMAVSCPFEVGTQETAGVGLWESGSGTTVHWLRTAGGRMTGYQIMSASTFNASPRDVAGQPGPIEQALIGSPIIEEPLDGSLIGIDALRVVHSYDPCMNCGTH